VPLLSLQFEVASRKKAFSLTELLRQSLVRNGMRAWIQQRKLEVKQTSLSGPGAHYHNAIAETMIL
jgi:hypothetical protein